MEEAKALEVETEQDSSQWLSDDGGRGRKDVLFQTGD